MVPAFHLRRQSEVYIGSAAELLPELLPAGRTVVVTDTSVERRWRPLLEPYERVVIGTGEGVKTLQTVGGIYRRFIELGVDRRTFVLGVGGGIVTDIAGFAAATYMRGLEFGFVSTTLLGQVDASVGGKNGVNVDGYKNMAGTFRQPRFVVCDPALLHTLPDREFRAGLAEAVKAAVIADEGLFALLERSSFDELRRGGDLLSDVVSASIRVKADIVERDERETGERRKLNLGHTLAHAIEKCSPRMNHGEAVAAGLSMVAGAAVHAGAMSAAECGRIDALLCKLGFELEPPVAVERLLGEVGRDKKREDGLLHVVLPRSIGDCEVRAMTVAEFAALFAV